jgi:OSK domain
MVGDDNFVNIAAFDLNFELSYRQTQGGRIRHCGDYCYSGLRIAQATRLIEKIDSSVQHVIFNVGSVDIAEGRDLIQLMQDIKRLLRTCNEFGIDPILTTLPPLPNYLLGYKKDVLKGFNDFLRYVIAKDCSVIDLNVVMVRPDGTVNFDNYQSIPRKVGGSHKAFVVWNRRGRSKIVRMIIRHLGLAMFYTAYLGTHF